MSQTRKPRVISSEDVDITSRETTINGKTETSVSEARTTPKYGRVVTDYNESGDQQRPKVDSGEQSQDLVKSPVLFISASTNADCMCKECSKRVYELEKIIADQIVYHKSCFKCVRCKRLLSLSNYASANGIPFCKPHFVELFKNKGNYEDWQLEETAPAVEAIGEESALEAVDDGAPVVKVALPEVKNMKMLFESPRGLSKRDSMTSQESLTATPFVKKSSKWDKPDRPPPPPVNRPVEGEIDVGVNNESDAAKQTENINPPADITKNLLSKFRELEQGKSGGGESVTVDRKPVRQFTPPRELESSGRTLESEKGEDDEDSTRVDKGELLKDEMPPPAITKNLLARFKSIESISSSSISAAPSPYGSNVSSPYRSQLPKQRTASFADLERAELSQVESGVFENAPIAIDVNVAREADANNEAELPEQGITKSLVAQWRAAESGAIGTPVRTGTPSRVSRSPSVSSTIKVRSSVPTVRTVAEEAEKGVGMDGGGGVSTGEVLMIEAEKLEEESLPPANITRNLLAMFKTLEGDGGGSGGSSGVTEPTDKQYKWQVKEVKPVNYRGVVTDRNLDWDGMTIDVPREDNDVTGNTNEIKETD